ncbi:uncharacterized protein LACBIDRAFT_301923 [Laccaria bicolor S238N-H82]|uniref:Uncharacterized protein n=1 Tax=Laccaria bicolor (strain S238N-H82 / ATCC MYA-4686) TaxID=486041 RepID=B0CPX7_LACBS|nr:uncharacterized protein LACBIDRAFT_301923 [Laccaria bicolor S238N-H82]EDR15489.1 hypothetical protein LACBIDRAFT_301923 [Laccaria bicolor S238N-H82]|eukprot:XP_001873697.1 hypothetical protein LACBIDRAFT_301923 [Laccaria bicolor S238N-H82]
MISEDLPGHNVQLFEDEASDSAMNDSDAITLLSDTFPGILEGQPIAITYERGTQNGSTDWDSEDTDDIQIPELKEALAQIKKELKEANLTHTRELEEVKRRHARKLKEVKRKHGDELEELIQTHALELEKAKKTHARELAEVRGELEEAQEEWEEAQETHEREINEALSKIRKLKAQSKVPSTFKKKLKAAENSGERLWYLFQVALKGHRSPVDDGVTDSKWHSTERGETFYTDGISRKETFSSSPDLYSCYLATNSSGKVAFVDKKFVFFC